MKSNVSLQKLKKIVGYNLLLSKQTRSTYLLLLNGKRSTSSFRSSTIKISLVNFFLPPNSSNRFLNGGRFLALTLHESGLFLALDAFADGVELTAYLVFNQTVFAFNRDTILELRALSTVFVRKDSALPFIGRPSLFVFSSLFKLLRASLSPRAKKLLVDSNDLQSVVFNKANG